MSPLKTFSLISAENASRRDVGYIQNQLLLKHVCAWVGGDRSNRFSFALLADIEYRGPTYSRRPISFFSIGGGSLSISSLPAGSYLTAKDVPVARTAKMRKHIPFSIIRVFEKNAPTVFF